LNHQYRTYSEKEMEAEVERSVLAQAEAEASDTQNFDDFLEDYFAYLKA